MSSLQSTAVVMPRLGESIVEGTIVRWLVRPGDPVRRGQNLAEVETDKATSEIPAPRDGVVRALCFPEGTTVEVGATILELEGGEARKDAAPALAAPPVPSAPAPSAPAAAGLERLPSQRLAPRLIDPAGWPLRSSPAVRRLARQHGLDLQRLEGSGRGGRITRADVLRHLEAGAAPQSAPPAEPATSRRAPAYRPPTYRPQPGDRVVPFSRRRAQVAEHMLHSLQTSAHVFAVAEIDMAAVLEARRLDLPRAEAAGARLTFLAYVVMAVARALREHPELNATVVDESLVLRAERNVGVAVDTEAGLVVPVVRRADELGLLGIARRLDEVAERARRGQLTPEDTSGGSFTISNPGKEGNLFGASIIRQPEVGILRIGTVVKRPVVRELGGEDVLAIRPMMYAALSYDHRVIDGRVGNAFLYRLTQLLGAMEPALAG